MDEKQLKVLKDALREVKDIVEATKHKVDRHDLFLETTAHNVRTIKEQQSIMNEKLDRHSKELKAITDRLDDPDDGLESINSRLEAVRSSVANMELTIEGYNEAYKANNDNIVKLHKRLNIVEEEQGINPPEELMLGEVG